jgi:hypothetical protein
MSELEYKVKVLKQYFTSILKKLNNDNAKSIGITTTGLEHIIKKVEDIEKLCKNH